MVLRAWCPVCIAAPMSIGDAVDVFCANGRRHAGMIEWFDTHAVQIRVAGLAVVVPPAQLRETGPGRWRVDL